MLDNLLHYHTPYLCKDPKGQDPLLNGDSVKEIKDILKISWVTLLVLLSLTSTVVAVAIINASLEYRATKLVTTYDTDVNSLHQSIQYKLDYLIKISTDE